MPRRSASLWLAILLLVCASTAHGEAFDIEDWNLAIGATWNWPHTVGHSFNDVSNPFADSHQVSLWESSSAASYDFAWWDAQGSFLIESVQEAEGVATSSLFTSASGFIWLTPAEDLNLSVEGAWTYDLPRDYMLATLVFAVYHSTENITLFSRGLNADTPLYGSASGTLAFDGEVTIPANETWIIQYKMRLETDAGTQGYMATGDGFIHFTLTPEPAAALLLLPLLLARRHIRRTLSHRNVH